MSQRKIKKYTLIDGFDKLDLSQQVSLKDTLVKETAVPKYSYTHPFLASPTSYKFLPDMFRFLTGRRFRIAPFGEAGSQWLLGPPPGVKTVSKYNDYINLREAYYPSGQEFYIDLLNLKEIINNNFGELSSIFKFQDYFLKPIGAAPGKTILGGADHADGISLSDYETRIKTTKALVAAAKKEPTYGVSDTKLTIGAFGASGQGSGQQSGDYGVFPYLFNSLKLLSLDPALMSQQLQGWVAAGLLGWADDALGRTIPAVVLQLMFLRLWSESAAKDVTPYHTYFVSDFTKGTTPAETDPTEVYFVAGALDKVKITSYYNYYDANFEAPLPNIKHVWQLPNPYVYNAYKSLDGDAAAYFRKLIVLGQDKSFNKAEFTIKDYINITRTSALSTAAQNFHNVPPTNWPQTALPMSLPKFSDPVRYRTIILSDKDLTNSTQTLKKAFPYGVDIDLGPKTPSTLMDIMKGVSPLSADVFLSMLANNTNNYQLENSAAHRFIIYRDFLDTAGLAATNYKSKFSLVDLQIFDLTAMLNEPMETYYDKYGKYINDNKNVNISSLPIPIEDVSEIGGALVAAGAVMAVTQKIKSVVDQYLNDNKLSIYQIYNGNKCHTEVIAYEIVKRRNLPAGTDNPILQSIFIPNTFTEDSPLSYLDTQVFYGEEYIYEIFAHTLVIGSTYFYTHSGSPPSLTPEGLGDAELEQDKYIEFNMKTPRTVNTLPYAVIVRAPYYNNLSLMAPEDSQKITRLIDKPPLPPEISFHSYQGKSRKVLLLLNQNYGEQLLIPNTQISPTDSVKVGLYKQAQKEDNHPPGHILYKTDDGRGTYEIYRISNEPYSWRSFMQDPTLKKISLDSTRQSGLDDEIQPNIDYYYFARFVDIHDNISNPTDIFKVRMVKEESTPAYMVLTAFVFKKPELVTRIPFKKYIKIALNDSIRDIVGEDASTATILYKPPGGVLKKYKFRITSIKTGKKIDINVDMKNTIIDKFAAKDLATIGGDVEGAPIVSPNDLSLSEVQKAGEKAITTANFGNNGETF